MDSMLTTSFQGQMEAISFVIFFFLSKGEVFSVCALQTVSDMDVVSTRSQGSDEPLLKLGGSQSSPSWQCLILPNSQIIQEWAKRWSVGEAAAGQIKPGC